MGTIKVAILEKDGIEFDTNVEIDLAEAIAYVGASTVNIPEYEYDPTSPISGQAWVTSGLKIGESLGLLLCLTNAAIGPYKFNYQTLEGTTVRTVLS